MKKKGIYFISMFIVISITTIAIIFSLSKTNQGSEKVTSVGGTNNNTTTKAVVVDGKISYHADDLDSLIKDSSLIVVAHVTDSYTELSFQMVNFVIKQLDVKRIFKNNGLSGDKISLLQTVTDLDPSVKTGSTVLLFLEKYEGPIPGAEDTYVCKGLYQGNYKIIGDKIEPSKDGNAKLKENIKQIKTLDEFKKKVDSIVPQK